MHMLLFHHQKAGKAHNIITPFENVTQFEYSRMTVTSQNLIHEKIKRRLNSDNAYFHSVQNLLLSHLVSENVKL
jgi:hypothetical protein